MAARVLAVVVVFAAAIAMPSAAHAWWRGGFGFGFVPLYVPPPPVYVPPPVYYGPPPVVYAPPPAGQACYAGPYVCPLETPSPLGAPCSCPTNTGRAGGRVG